MGRKPSPLEWKPSSAERMLRAEELMEEGGARAWLLVTTERLVFSTKDRLDAREHWSMPLGCIESAVAGDDMGFGIHKFVVYYRDPEGKQQRKVFKHTNFTKGILLGPLSKVGPNPLIPLEQVVQQARAWWSQSTVSAPGASPYPTSGNLAGELERLADLRQRGALTDEEFLAAKARLLR